MDPCDMKDLDCEEFVKTRKKVKRKTIRRNGKKIRIKKIIRQKVIIKCCKKPITKPIPFCKPRPDVTAACPPFFPKKDDCFIYTKKFM